MMTPFQGEGQLIAEVIKKYSVGDIYNIAYGVLSEQGNSLDSGANHR
jgi:hypothetical protein